MQEISAYLATLVLAGLTIFQVALILGAPIGRFAWGGSSNVLPTKLRLASVVSIALYFFFAVIVLARAGIVQIGLDTATVNTVTWVITAYFFVGIAMNAISRSKPERAVMTPTALVLAILFLIVALN